MKYISPAKTPALKDHNLFLAQGTSVKLKRFRCPKGYEVSPHIVGGRTVIGSFWFLAPKSATAAEVAAAAKKAKVRLFISDSESPASQYIRDHSGANPAEIDAERKMWEVA